MLVSEGIVWVAICPVHAAQRDIRIVSRTMGKGRMGVILLTLSILENILFCNYEKAQPDAMAGPLHIYMVRAVIYG